MHGMRLLPSDMWINKLRLGFSVCRNLNKARHFNKKSERIEYRLMRLWRMRSVISIGLGRIHKEKLKSQNFRKSIGILLLIHNMTNDQLL